MASCEENIYAQELGSRWNAISEMQLATICSHAGQ